MDWNLLKSHADSARAAAPEYSIADIAEGVYPFWDKDKEEGKAAAVKAYQLLKFAEDKTHVVLIGYTGPDEFFIWCGDGYVEGGKCVPPPEKRINAALPSIAKPEAEATAALVELRGRFSKSSGCNFWMKYNKDGSLCKHCNQLLYELSAGGTLEGVKDELEERFTRDVENGKPSSSGLPATTLAKTALRVPVLLEGEKGWGKSTEARMLAEEIGAVYLEIQGNESVEAADIKGYWMRYGDQMVWKDGKLAEAFRRASKGEKVVLNIDEMLRIPQRQLSVLMSALSPFKGKYSLDTGRIVSVNDGVGTEETLSCPKENLIIVATTNVGSQYAVDAIDPALMERFVVKRKQTDVEFLRKVTAQAAKGRGFPESIADKCVAFYQAMVGFKPHGFVAGVPNPRTMVRAIEELAETPEDLNRAVKELVLLWVGRTVDGEPQEEQLKHVLKAIDSVFK